VETLGKVTLWITYSSSDEEEYKKDEEEETIEGAICATPV